MSRLNKKNILKNINELAFGRWVEKKLQSPELKEFGVSDINSILQELKKVAVNPIDDRSVAKGGLKSRKPIISSVLQNKSNQKKYDLESFLEKLEKLYKMLYKKQENNKVINQQLSQINIDNESEQLGGDDNLLDKVLPSDDLKGDLLPKLGLQQLTVVQEEEEEE